MFGGGAVLAGMTTMNIGDRNSEFVRRYLALEKIRIVAEDLQGMPSAQGRVHAAHRPGDGEETAPAAGSRA